jgi:biopolymer transport protein ExbD
MGGMISNAGHEDTEEPMAQINVTSLIDVMFCLLIGFMVATPLANQDKLQIDLPKARGAPLSEEEFLYTVISIDGEGNVFLGATPLSKDRSQMANEIANNAKLKEDGMAYIQGDKTVPYEKIIDVMVALKQAGVSDVGFVTDPKVDG